MSKSKNVRKTQASKVINPQRKLDAMKALVKKAGGKMAYEGKTWIVRKGKQETELTSRKLATYNLPGFAKAFRLPQPSA